MDFMNGLVLLHLEIDRKTRARRRGQRLRAPIGNLRWLIGGRAK